MKEGLSFKKIRACWCGNPLLEFYHSEIRRHWTKYFSIDKETLKDLDLFVENSAAEVRVSLITIKFFPFGVACNGNHEMRATKSSNQLFIAGLFVPEKPIASRDIRL